MVCDCSLEEKSEIIDVFVQERDFKNRRIEK